MVLPVVVDLPNGTGGRRVSFKGRLLGTAFSLLDLTVFLQHASLEGWDELDVGACELIEWRGGARTPGHCEAEVK
ncbi:hypothetical protein ACIHFC_13220 [Streptomyces sp. NPDC052013]|uniref:hypothetical protein n=1 Tax=Streptomyces sp. NPDC052013 TaxID=3365679 RepID=UPI0037CCDF33